jgi:radical SAM-linked protein
MAAQRIRMVFRKGVQIKYISHLDLMRAWERALRRADVPLAYSEGFNPRPKLQFASALPVGLVGRAELLDIFLDQRLESQVLAKRVEAQLPHGLELATVSEVPLQGPSLPSQVVAAEYKAVVHSKDMFEEVGARISALLALESIPRTRERPRGAKSYDLRPLIQELQLMGMDGDCVVIAMHLRAGPKGTGRPDEVLAALGMAEAASRIERVALILRSS